MASLKIRIGASVDASVNNAFSSVTKAAQQAGAAIRKNMTDATRQAAHAASAAAGPYRQTVGSTVRAVSFASENRRIVTT